MVYGIRYAWIWIHQMSLHSMVGLIYLYASYRKNNVVELNSTIMASTFGNHSYYCFSFPKLLQKGAWPSSFMVVSTPLIELKLPES